MIAYPDTSFLCALYRQQANSADAARHFEKMTEALHVSTLLLFEFRQSIRFQGFLQQQGLKRTSERTALIREIFSIHYHFEADELLFKMKEKNVMLYRCLKRSFAHYLLHKQTFCRCAIEKTFQTERLQNDCICLTNR